ncbi:hypothetical protein TWF730_002507 [Orbilia blumenaviensis]|uniref:Zn(2)-C6 fungal-type domain-containing protein n=1 Tax=Orbilia blumenaviensis TaxID=1796055 RepID=A0AAV9UBQ8_9PEZI
MNEPKFTLAEWVQLQSAAGLLGTPVQSLLKLFTPRSTSTEPSSIAVIPLQSTSNPSPEANSSSDVNPALGTLDNDSSNIAKELSESTIATTLQPSQTEIPWDPFAEQNDVDSPPDGLEALAHYSGHQPNTPAQTIKNPISNSRKRTLNEANLTPPDPRSDEPTTPSATSGNDFLEGPGRTKQRKTGTNSRRKRDNSQKTSTQNPPLKWHNYTPSQNPLELGVGTIARRAKSNRKPQGSSQNRIVAKDVGIAGQVSACKRCNDQKIKCEPNPLNVKGICLTCLRVISRGRTRLSQMPCSRYSVSDTTLFVKGEHPQFRWSQRWKSMEIVEIENWASPETMTIYLTQDVGETYYPIKVRKCHFIEGDARGREWVTKGKKYIQECPPYVMADMQETSKILLQYANRSVETYISHYILPRDPLIRETYVRAYSCTQPGKDELDDTAKGLLRQLFTLWVAMRMENRPERILPHDLQGDEFIQQIQDPEAYNYGHILVSPILSAQIELLTTGQLLNPLKDKVLSSLQRLVETEKRKYWFPIYFTIFILLDSCEVYTAYEEVQARKYGLETKYWHPEIVRQMHDGTKILLAWFHHCTKGASPFTVDWSKVNTETFAELNSDQVAFIQRTANMVKEKKDQFQRARETANHSEEFYFIGQLFEENWNPT